MPEKEQKQAENELKRLSKQCECTLARLDESSDAADYAAWKNNIKAMINSQAKYANIIKEAFSKLDQVAKFKNVVPVKAYNEAYRKDPKQACRDLRSITTEMKELNQTASLTSATSEEENDKKYLEKLKLKKKEANNKDYGTSEVLDSTMDGSTEVDSTPKKKNINDTSEVMDASTIESKEAGSGKGITTPKPPTAQKLQATTVVKLLQDKIEAKEETYEQTKALNKVTQEEKVKGRADNTHAENDVEILKLKLTAKEAQLEATTAANEFKAAMTAMNEHKKDMEIEIYEFKENKLQKAEQIITSDAKAEPIQESNTTLENQEDMVGGGHNTKEGRQNRNVAFVERVKFFPPNEKKEKESKESNAMTADTNHMDEPLVEEDVISCPWLTNDELTALEQHQLNLRSTTYSSSYVCNTKVQQQESTYESVEPNDVPKEEIYDNVEIHELTKDKNDQDKVHNKEYEIRGGMPIRDNDDYNCHGLPKSKVHEKDAYAIHGEQKRKVHEDKIHGEQKDKKLNQEICDNVDGLQHHELRKEKEKKKAIEHNLLATCKEIDVKSEYLNENCIGAYDKK